LLAYFIQQKFKKANTVKKILISLYYSFILVINTTNFEHGKLILGFSLKINNIIWTKFKFNYKIYLKYAIGEVEQ